MARLRARRLSWPCLMVRRLCRIAAADRLACARIAAAAKGLGNEACERLSALHAPDRAPEPVIREAAPRRLPGVRLGPGDDACRTTLVVSHMVRGAVLAKPND